MLRLPSPPYANAPYANACIIRITVRNSSARQRTTVKIKMFSSIKFEMPAYVTNGQLLMDARVPARVLFRGGPLITSRVGAGYDNYEKLGEKSVHGIQGCSTHGRP